MFLILYFRRHSNGSGENEDGDDQPDDAGSLSRSASESSVAQAQIENGLNINNNGYTLVTKKKNHNKILSSLCVCDFVHVIFFSACFFFIVENVST